jgi:superfamily II DNA or RNA helicase
VADQVTIASNAVVAKLVNASDAAMAHVSELLSYDVQGREFAISFQTGSWSGRSTFFSHTSQTFPAGFVHMVEDHLSQKGIKVHKVAKGVPMPLGPENPIVDEFGNDDPRYNFQMHAVRQVERHGRGILQVATGGGKSKIAKLLIARFRRPTLFVTTRGILMYQMADHIETGRMRSGIIGDGIWQPHPKGINCGMVQTLVARLRVPDLNDEIRSFIKKGDGLTREQIRQLGQDSFEQKMKTREETIALLETIEVVIGEEAHEAGGNSYFDILKHCKNASVRVALTGTPFMKEDVESNMRLMAAFGPILIRVSEETLIKRGILARPYFKFHLSQPHEKLRKTSPWQRAYELGYVTNENMLKDIVRDALKAQKAGLPIMCLVLRTSHGDKILAAMKKNGIKAVFIKGENNQKERKAALSALKARKIDAIIGTNILDVGVDVPAVGLVQLAGGGKAEIALRQRIGRGLRSKKGGPNVCFVIDYSTTGNSHLRDHAYQRRKIIEATPGFVEGIVAEGQDLPWEIFTGPSQSSH